MLIQIHQFWHNPNKEDQNWSVEDAVAQQQQNTPALQRQPDQDLKFSCPCCESQFDVWLHLVEHVTNQHSVNDNQQVVNTCLN